MAEKDKFLLFDNSNIGLPDDAQDLESLRDIQALNNKLIDTQRQLLKEKRRAELAIQEKEAFLSRMSHDIRTPLNGILGFTEIALHETDEGKRIDDIRKIEASGRLLRDIVNDVLDIFRAESGADILIEEPVDNCTLWESVLTVVRPLAEKKQIAISGNAESCDDCVMADQLKLQKIFLNLLSNAIKYTQPGGTVRADMEKLNPDGSGFTRRYTVTDSGIGMSPEFLKNLYKPFTQEQRLESAGTVGTGLGLAIVKQLVDLMGGKISVESNIGRGTSFSVDLPLKEAQRAAEEGQIPVNAAASLRGRHILLCEDNNMNAEIASRLLYDQGIAVDRAENGEKGISRFLASSLGYYDCILMDIHMPVMDGYEATKAIRALNRSDAKTVPIIAMTADAFADDVQKCLDAGMNGHTAKPIEPQKLYLLLKDFIRG